MAKDAISKLRHHRVFVRGMLRAKSVGRIPQGWRVETVSVRVDLVKGMLQVKIPDDLP